MVTGSVPSTLIGFVSWSPTAQGYGEGVSGLTGHTSRGPKANQPTTATRKPACRTQSGGQCARMGRGLLASDCGHGRIIITKLASDRKMQRLPSPAPPRARARLTCGGADAGCERQRQPQEPPGHDARWARCALSNRSARTRGCVSKISWVNTEAAPDGEQTVRGVWGARVRVEGGCRVREEPAHTAAGCAQPGQPAGTRRAAGLGSRACAGRWLPSLAWMSREKQASAPALAGNAAGRGPMLEHQPCGFQCC